MTATSAGWAWRIEGSIRKDKEDRDTEQGTGNRNNAFFLLCPASSVRLCSETKKAPAKWPGHANANCAWGLAAIAEKAQHEQEKVDEVEIERQRAHHGLAAYDGAVLLRYIHFLDLLGVPGGEARKDQHASGRDHEIEPA